MPHPTMMIYFQPLPDINKNGGKLLRELGVGSREWGFLILIFNNSYNHGIGNLLPWIMKLWIWMKFLDLGLGSVKKK